MKTNLMNIDSYEENDNSFEKEFKIKRTRTKALHDVPEDIQIKASKIKLIEVLPFTTICSHWGYDNNNKLLRALFSTGGDYIYTNISAEEFQSIDTEFGGSKMLNDIICNPDHICYKLTDLNINKNIKKRKLTKEEKEMIKRWKERTKAHEEKKEDIIWSLKNNEIVSICLQNIDAYQLNIDSEINHKKYR